MIYKDEKKTYEGAVGVEETVAKMDEQRREDWIRWWVEGWIERWSPMKEVEVMMLCVNEEEEELKERETEDEGEMVNTERDWAAMDDDWWLSQQNKTKQTLG